MPLRGKGRFKRNLRARADQYYRALTLEALGRLMRRTPVDTGRARANWNVSVDEIDRSEDPDATRGDIDAARARGQAVLAQLTVGRKAFLTNSVPYIRELEGGSSQQAPEGMVELTAAELRPLAARIAAQVASGSPNTGDST